MQRTLPRYTRFIDDATGRPYIHDSHSGAVTWDLPPQEWVPFVDEKTGRTFWYNQVTKERQWQNPNLANKLQGKTGANQNVVNGGNSKSSSPMVKNEEELARWKSSIDLKTGRMYWYDPLTLRSSWKPPKIRTEGSVSDSFKKDEGKNQTVFSLGLFNKDWEMFKDTRTNSVFYFHRQLGISQWSLPGSKETIQDLHEDIGSKTNRFPGEQPAGNSNAMGSEWHRKASATPETNEVILVSGVLGESVILPKGQKAWRNRFFSLSDKGVLLRASTPGDKVQAPNTSRGKLALNMHDVAGIDDDEGTLQFSIKDTFDRQLCLLKAPSHEEFEAWLAALTKVMLETTTSLQEEPNASLTGTRQQSLRDKVMSPSLKTTISDSSISTSTNHAEASSPGLIRATKNSSSFDRSESFVIARSPNLLTKLTGQAKALASELRIKAGLFRLRLGEVQEAKLKLSAAAWMSKNGQLVSPIKRTSTGSEDSAVLRRYAVLLYQLRKYPGTIAAIGAAQPGREAQRMLAQSLVTTILDFCSVPSSLCLKEVIASAKGNSFGTQLFEVLASYHVSETIGRDFLSDLYANPKATVVSCLDTMMDRCKCDPNKVAFAFGREFLTILIERTLKTSRSELVCRENVIVGVLEVIKDRRSPKLELAFKHALEASNTPASKQRSDFMPLKFWNKFVASRFDLFTIHMAISKVASTLPEDLRIIVEELGTARPLFVARSSHPYDVLAVDEVMDEVYSSMQALLASLNLYEEDNDDEIEGSEDVSRMMMKKTMIRRLLDGIESSRMRLSTMENSIDYLDREAEKLASQLNTVKEGDAVPLRFSSPGNRSGRSDPSSPATSIGSRSPSGFDVSVSQPRPVTPRSNKTTGA